MRGATAKRAVATVERAAEPLADGPLKFDFAPKQLQPVVRLEKAASIKEALLRWLDQQL